MLLRFEPLEERRLLSLEGVGELPSFGDLSVDLDAYHSSRVIVCFDGEPSGEVRGKRLFGDANLWRIDLVGGESVDDALAAFNARDDIVFAARDHRVHVASITPNDPDFSDLWGLNNTGQTGGAADADIDAPEAWETWKTAMGIEPWNADSEVVVAVIDSGVDYNHPDLIDNMWSNTEEVPGNGIDDDGNGYVDDVHHGWDWANNDNDPMDDLSHGTHVAGTIAAVGNNGSGVVGVAPNVKIMALKFLDNTGYGYTSDAIAALEYAVLNGAQISNNSYIDSAADASMEQAIQAAGEDHLFVAAAGNGVQILWWVIPNDNDASPRYPANDQPNPDTVIAVAASDHNDNYADFSNYGASSVDLAAPGVDIWSTVPGGYAYKSGTSMAAPHVAGAAALIWSTNPELTATQVKGVLLDNTDDIFDSSKPTVTNGRLNVDKALVAALALAPPLPALSINDVTVAEDDTGPVEAVFTVTLWPASDQTVTVDYATANDTATAPDDFTHSSGTVTFDPGVTEQTISVPITADTLVEGTETFLLNLTNPHNATIQAGQCLGSITDNDTATLGFALADSSVGEAAGTHAVEVTLTIPGGGSLAQAVSVDVADLFGSPGGGTATAGVDYTFTDPTPVIFAAGSITGSQSVTLNLGNDVLVEGPETVELQLSNLADPTGQVSLAAPQGHTVTISDDDVATLSFALADSSVGEAAGTHTVDVMLTISNGGSLTQAVSVDVADLFGAPGPGIATPGEDYSFTDPTPVNFEAGSESMTKSVVLNVIEDGTTEVAEAVNLELTNVSDATGQVSLTVAAHTVTIVDNDVPTVSFDIASSTIGEANVSHNLVVRLTVPGGGTLGAAVTVDVTDAGTGAALSGVDYDAFAGETVTFIGGSLDGTEQNVTLNVLHDLLVEGDETLDLTLGNVTGPASLGAPSTHTVTITDDETVGVSFQVSSSTASEAGSPHAVLVQLTAAPGVTLAVPVTVDVTDAGTGTALSGSDYGPFGTQPVTFGVGSGNGATQNASLNVLNDFVVEGDETVVLTLGNVSALADLSSPSVHTVTITDDDDATISFALADSNVGEATGTHAVDVTLTIPGGGSLAQAVSVDVADLFGSPGGGTATAGVDYSLVDPTTLTFEAGSGSSTRSVTLNLVDDVLVEDPETVNLRLGNLSDPTGKVALAAPQDHAVTINDDDGVTTLHVGDLDGTSTIVNKRKWRATVDVLVLNDTGLPVSDAVVEGTWSNGVSSIATTDAGGVARGSSGNVDKSIPSVTFTVDNITHATLSYESAGDSIVVLQPVESASATDAALMGFFDLDLSDEDETDLLATHAADELAMIMLE